MKSNYIKSILVLIASSALTGCMAGNPKITNLTGRGSNGKFATSTKQNLAMAGGTATSGAYKVKFSMGTMGGASSSQVSLTSGLYKIRPAPAGVLRE